MTESLERDALVPALLGSAWWVGAREPPEAMPRALGWLRAAWAEGEEQLPLALVHDLGFLLLRGPSFATRSARDLDTWPQAERGWRLAYEDRVLGQWLQDASLHEAHVAIAGLPEERQPEVLAHAIVLALAEPLRGHEGALLGNAAYLRSLTPELAESQHEVPPVEWLDRTRQQLDGALAALPDGPLLSRPALWELEHFAELPSASARMASRALNRACDAVGRVSASVAARVERRAKEVVVEEHAEADIFPAGGFDGISQRGRFENLVRSEVGYVGVGAMEGVDLFDLRWVSGELLYYTRDESPLLDARRSLHFVIDRPASLRFKHPELPGQTLTLVCGLCLAMLGDLARILGPKGCTVSWSWTCAGPEDEAVAQAEEALLNLSALNEVRRGRLRFGAGESLTPTLHISPRARSGALGRRDRWLRVDASVWHLEPDQRFDPRRQLRALADALLLGLLAGG